MVRELRLDNIVEKSLAQHKGVKGVEMSYRDIEPIRTVQPAPSVKVISNGVDPNLQKLMEAMIQNNNIMASIGSN